MLVCWHHGRIPELAAALGATKAPGRWGDAVFDRVWVVTFDGKGDANPLADLLVLLGAVSSGEPSIARVPAIELITAAPRRALRLPPLSVKVGEPADVVVLEAAEPESIPRGIEQVRYVFKSGRVVWPAA